MRHRASLLLGVSTEMRRALLVVVLAAFSLLTVVSCGGGGAQGGNQQISTKMSEMKFDPNTWTIKAGQPVTMTAQNVGTVAHDFSIRGTTPEVTLLVQPGQTGTTTFTIAKAGTYEVYCNQPGHEAAGMKGTLTVQ
jgi:nitrite reductase (NO-forming)